MRSAAVCLLSCMLLSACYTSPPDPVVGAWDRFIADGTWLPADGPRDRYTFYARGDVRLERDGQTHDGRTPDVDGSYVTIQFADSPAAQLYMWKQQCIDRLEDCLLMSGIDADRAKAGPVDWYHGAQP